MCADLGSQSGTFVNGEKVVDAGLESGDEFKLGDVTFEFHVGVPRKKGGEPTTQVSSLTATGIPKSIPEKKLRRKKLTRRLQKRLPPRKKLTRKHTKKLQKETPQEKRQRFRIRSRRVGDTRCDPPSQPQYVSGPRERNLRATLVGEDSRKSQTG